MDNHQGEFVIAPDKNSLKERFKAAEEEQAAMFRALLEKNDGVFVVGEEVMVKGSRFRVLSFTRKGRLTLRLLPRGDRASVGR
jgi:hypothetical protein